MRRLALGTALVALLFSSFVLVYTALQVSPARGQEPTPMGGMQVTPQPGGMAGMPAASGPTVPPVKGFAEGQEIRFIHTEASAPEVAQMLTTMMGSPVLVVPALAQAPDTMLANVYAFQNGVRLGEGPFGLQSDVFDRPPPDPAYSPLRVLNVVRWRNGATPRELKSAAEIRDAEARGELMTERPGVVVNMPMLTWPGGQR